MAAEQAHVDDMAFLATLQDAGTKFIAADMPEANELTIHIMAAMAQAERKAISPSRSSVCASMVNVPVRRAMLESSPEMTRSEPSDRP